MLRTALRPQWVAFLLVVMVFAAVFAWLGKWQLERAVIAAQPVNTATEIVVPLASLTAPGQAIPVTAGAHMAQVSGVQVPDSFTILTGRLNQGAAGFWVVGRVVTSGQGASAVSLPVAYGWASTQAQAEQAITTLNAAASTAAKTPTTAPATSFTGRFMPAEGPAEPSNKANPAEQNTLAPAALVNQWPAYQGSIYWGYLIDAAAPAGLVAIDSKPPVDDASLNWLNIFYAIEWVVFAGFAFYIWWRMVKDAWERELEEKSLVAAAAEPGDPGKPATGAN
jgi:surfeit locus 1 family protein